MSFSHHLLLFSLCLSLLHACNARPLGAIDNKKLEKKFHISNNKNDEKGIDKVPALPKTNKSSLSNELAATRGDGYKETSLLVHKAQKLKDTKVETTSGGAVKTVSWRLPRSKRGEKDHVFTSDYSPPKTHPPSHNINS